MLKTRINSLLAYLKGKKILITTHYPLDLDGYVSSIALKFFLEKFFDHQEIALNIPKISKYVRNFIKKFTEKFPDFPFAIFNKLDLNSFDALIILDTNNIDQVKLMEDIDISDLNIPYFFIDHHYTLNTHNNANLKPLNIIIDHYSSTVEIILELFKKFKFKISKPLKILFIAAILSDSGFLRYGTNQTVFNISSLLEENVSFQEILRLLESDIDISERIAKIKGLQRVDFLRIGEWLVGISHVSSFTASVASSLISIGFDVSIVNSEKKNQTIITTRASQEVCQKTGLHLGKLLNELGDINAGGHEGAASLNCHIDSELILKKLIKEIKKVLIN